MELKLGYKQTEVGVIPEDWKVAPFGQLSSIERGKFSASRLLKYPPPSLLG